MRRRTTLFLLGITLLAAAPLGATVIDTFDNTSFWASFADSAGATASTGVVAGADGNAVQLTYDLTHGGFAGLTGTVTSQNLISEGANAVKFQVRATGVANTLELKFIDTDSSTTTDTCDKMDYKQLLNPDGAWREITVPFSDFKLFPDGNKSFNVGSAQRLGIVVTKDNGTTGAGTVYVDDFRLCKLAGAASTIDSFETANTNARGLGATFFSDGVSGGYAIYVTSQAVTGSKALELHYSIAAGTGRYAGIAEVLGGLVAANGNERLEFYAKGAAGNEPLKIEIWHTNDTAIVSRSLSSYGTITTSYQKFSIPLSDFTGLDLKSITQIKLIFTDGAGSGVVYLDDVAVVSPETETKNLRMLDDFQLPYSQIPYITASHRDASLTPSTLPDTTPIGAQPDNRVLRLDYELKASTETPWVVLERKLRPNLLAEPALRFRFAGTGGNNDLEVKLTDSDGTVYLRKFVAVTNTNGAWKTASVPVTDFGLNASGTDGILTLTDIVSIVFGVARGEKKSGTFTLDLVESAPGEAFRKDGVGAVLRSVSVPDNPFSPNDDGIKDTARFVLALSRNARITLRIYSLRGVPLKTFDAGELAAGDHTLVWDGIDADGRRVANGLYLFHLEAEGSNGDKDFFKEIIGVMR